MRYNLKAALFTGGVFLGGYFIGKCMGQKEILDMPESEFVKAKEDLVRTRESLKTVWGQKFNRKVETEPEQENNEAAETQQASPVQG